MPLDYCVGTAIYSLSYTEMKEQYHKFVKMSDDEFVENLPAALHFACFVCWFKEIPTYVCLIDDGIIHELAHLLHKDVGYGKYELKKIRKLFKEQLKLA